LMTLSQGRYRATQTQKKGGQTDMLRVGLKPMIPVFKGAKTFCALDRAATVMQNFQNIFRKETLLACNIFKIENHCFLQCDSLHLIQKYCPYPEDRSCISLNGGSMFTDAFALTYQTARCHNVEDNINLHRSGNFKYCVTQISVEKPCSGCLCPRVTKKTVRGENEWCNGISVPIILSGTMSRRTNLLL
jgi:hypothetical protein